VKKRINVDVVAFVLALALGTAVVLIMTGIIINIAGKKNPTPTLGENPTKVKIGIMGGIIGILGSYIGSRGRDREKNDEEE